ncbi:MAG: CopG family transcriptional regulator [Desulforegulaceae bacterium]|nr:CopG family transcriptional regulator [Desulforegulaceae bacterium]
MLSVKLPEDLEKRLNDLVSKTNRTKSFYAVEALPLYIEDLEDLYLSEKAFEEFLLNGEKALSSEEVRKKLGL